MIDLRHYKGTTLRPAWTFFSLAEGPLVDVYTRFDYCDRHFARRFCYPTAINETKTAPFTPDDQSWGIIDPHSFIAPYVAPYVQTGSPFELIIVSAIRPQDWPWPLTTWDESRQLNIK